MYAHKRLVMKSVDKIAWFEISRVHQRSTSGSFLGQTKVIKPKDKYEFMREVDPLERTRGRCVRGKLQRVRRKRRHRIQKLRRWKGGGLKHTQINNTTFGGHLFTARNEVGAK